MSFLLNTGLFVFVGILLIVLVSVGKNNSFINITSIFSGYITAFKENKIRLAVFYLSPIIISFGIANFRTVSKEILDNINIVITIILSIFFVMIDLIENKHIRPIKEFNDALGHSEADFIKVKKETIDIILVDAIYSVLYLFISFSIQFIGTDNKEMSVLLYIISIIIYSIVLIVVIHLLIILKRFRIILNYQ